MAKTILSALGETPPGWVPYTGYMRESVLKAISITQTEQEADALQAQIDHATHAQSASK